MITEEQIESNKNKFIYIISDIKRPCNKDGLIEYLNNSDFFYAPATTMYFGSYRGGLCEYCLNVYNNFLNLLQTELGLSDKVCAEGDFDTPIIVSLLHAIGKINCYESYVGNKKVYRENGSKKDYLGKFDWVPYMAYKYRDRENRVIVGNQNETSAYVTNFYVPLYVSEYSAILCSSFDYSDSTASNSTIYDSYNTYLTSSILHMAIEYTMFINTRAHDNEQNN